MSQPPHDEALMDRVARDDPSALEPLIRRHGGDLLTFIQRMVGRRQLAEDVFQEVTLRLWKHRKRFKPWQKFRPWLFAIAANEARRALRPRAVRAIPVDGQYSVLARLVTNETAPDDAAVDDESAAQVRAALMQLSVKHREVVVLRVWGRMSYVVIAKTLKRRETTVRSQMHHALRKLRPLLASAARQGSELI